MMMKLLEDPNRDYDALLQDFTDGFYGSAGPAIRRYLIDLQAAAEASGSKVDWFPALSQYRYLTLEFIRRAQTTADEAEKAVSGDPVDREKSERAIRDLGMPAGAPVICGVGRLGRVKGFDLLIDAFRGVLTEVPFMLLLVQLCKATKGTFRR